MRELTMCCALLLVSVTANADLIVPLSSVAGKDLARVCLMGEHKDEDFCSGYILGVADRLQLEGETCHKYSAFWTANTSRTVRRYIRDHPEAWYLHGAMLVTAALKDAYSC